MVRVAVLTAATITGTVALAGAALIVASRITCRHIRKVTANNRPTHP